MFRKAHKSLLDTVFLLALLVAPTVWCADLTVRSEERSCRERV